jgi:hypothetical protein
MNLLSNLLRGDTPRPSLHDTAWSAVIGIPRPLDVPSWADKGSSCYQLGFLDSGNLFLDMTGSYKAREGAASQRLNERLWSDRGTPGRALAAESRAAGHSIIGHLPNPRSAMLSPWSSCMEIPPALLAPHPPPRPWRPSRPGQCRFQATPAPRALVAPAPRVRMRASQLGDNLTPETPTLDVPSRDTGAGAGAGKRTMARNGEFDRDNTLHPRPATCPCDPSGSSIQSKSGAPRACTRRAISAT